MVNPAVRFRFIKGNRISSTRYRNGYFEREVINERELKFIQNWEQKRRLSKTKYIIFHGLFSISFPLLFIVKLIQILIESGEFFIFYSSKEGLLFLFFELIFWFAGGIAIGWLRHNFYETQYQLLTGKAEY
jgi:hypothetical protein